MVHILLLLASHFDMDSKQKVVRKHTKESFNLIFHFSVNIDVYLREHAFGRTLQLFF